MAPKVSFISLGCAKNTVDSEVMLGRLALGGFTVCQEYADSDVVVVNTCGFLQSAEKEAIETIGRATRLKRRGRVKAVVVAGCLPQRYGPEVEKKLRDVDAIVGVTDREKIAEVCRAALAGTHPEVLNLVDRNYPSHEVDRDRLRITPRHYGYLRVAEGCNHTCAFCIIPHIRGRFRSKPIEELLREARELAADGAVELCLIGQDTSEYGLDLYRETRLHELLARLGEIDGVRWIRCHYMYPTMVSDRQIREIARNPKVVKYIDMPIQHTRERMLRIMRRGITQKKQDELIERLRAEIPGLAMRTTVIVGHPGETREDHEAMLEDLRKFRFERLGAFTYSTEPGTAAALMEKKVPRAEQARRYNAVMSAQRSIAREIHRGWIGRTLECIVDEVPEKGAAIGRTAADAPDVDGRIYLKGAGLRPGSLVRARVTAAREYDLLGVL
jgi:ribosomal protein S12 methylthiotransferase